MDETSCHILYIYILIHINISHLSYPERLAALNLPTLVYLRIRGDMIENFKFLSNIYDSRVTNVLSKGKFSTTRIHNFKLFVRHENFNIRKWFFSIRIVDIWNRLPSSIVNAPNVMCLEETRQMLGRHQNKILS